MSLEQISLIYMNMSNACSGFHNLSKINLIKAATSAHATDF